MNSQLMEYTPTEVSLQVQNIQHLKENVLIDKEHYGLIPGCGPKPALLKAGAEKLAFMFRLSPKFIISKSDLDKGHREYEITCELVHIPTGQYIGAGLGICSTMETKYRYRADKGVDTMLDVQVPKAYWNKKNAGATGPELQAILAEHAGEPGRFGTKKDSNDQWVIVKRGESTGEKVENPDIADTYNTVIKMAKKRAYVDAVITCTAASDFFTQDIEETMGDTPIHTAAAVVKDGDAELEWVKEKAGNCSTVEELAELKDQCHNILKGWHWTDATKAVLAARHSELNNKP